MPSGAWLGKIYLNLDDDVACKVQSCQCNIACKSYFTFYAFRTAHVCARMPQQLYCLSPAIFYELYTAGKTYQLDSSDAYFTVANAFGGMILHQKSVETILTSSKVFAMLAQRSGRHFRQYHHRFQAFFVQDHRAQNVCVGNIRCVHTIVKR